MLVKQRSLLLLLKTMTVYKNKCIICIEMILSWIESHMLLLKPFTTTLNSKEWSNVLKLKMLTLALAFYVAFLCNIFVTYFQNKT